MSQSSQNLVKSYENDVICEKNEENDDIRELQDQYESDAEYGDFDLDDPTMTVDQAKMYLQYGTYVPIGINPLRWKTMIRLIQRGVV